MPDRAETDHPINLPDKPALEGLEDKWNARWQQAGTYRFDAPMSAVDVIRKIAKGDIWVRRITFPEGRNMMEMAGIFEHYVMQPNLRIKQQLEDAGVDLIFHDCGELTVYMVEQFATRLYPVILSLGSSRKLWEDAAIVPKHVVLYGNLPTKNFYSDDAVPLDAVPVMARDLIGRMRTLSGIGYRAVD